MKRRTVRHRVKEDRRTGTPPSTAPEACPGRIGQDLPAHQEQVRLLRTDKRTNQTHSPGRERKIALTCGPEAQLLLNVLLRAFGIMVSSERQRGVPRGYLLAFASIILWLACYGGAHGSQNSQQPRPSVSLQVQAAENAGTGGSSGGNRRAMQQLRRQAMRYHLQLDKESSNFDTMQLATDGEKLGLQQGPETLGGMRNTIMEASRCLMMSSTPFRHARTCCLPFPNSS